MVACVHACMRACMGHGSPWTSMHHPPSSPLELASRSTCDTLLTRWRILGASDSVYRGTPQASCYGEKKLLNFAGRGPAPPSMPTSQRRLRRPPFRTCFALPRSDSMHQGAEFGLSSTTHPSCTRTFRSSRSERCCTLSIAPNCCWRCSLSGRALWCPCPAGTAPGGPRATSSPASPSPVRASCRTSTSPGEASTSCCRA